MSGRASLRDDASIGPYRLIFKAIPHNSKCRYGERGAAAAKPKAQIILGCCKGERRQWRKQRTEAGAAVTECEGLLPPKHDAGTATRHYRAFWQRRCRAAAAEAVLKPLGGNCAVLPKIKTNRPEPACTIAVPGFGPVCLLVTTHFMRQSSQGTLHAAKS